MNLFSFIFKIIPLLKSMTLSTAIEKFTRRLIVTKRPATVHYYRFYFALLQRHLGDIALTALDEDRLLGLIISLKAQHPNMKNITINKTLSALKTMVKYTANLNLTITRLSETKLLIPLIPEKTIHTILHHLQSNIDRPNQLRNFLIVKILLETGLRMNELIHLQKINLDLASNTLLVKVTKTNRHRLVFFKDDTIPFLHRLVALHPHVPWIFYDLQTLQPMTTASIESFFYQLKRRLHLTDNITPHKWRHTFATQFLRQGGNLETLRLILGHSNLKTTQKYLHLSDHDLRSQYRQIMDAHVPKS